MLPPDKAPAGTPHADRPMCRHHDGHAARAFRQEMGPGQRWPRMRLAWSLKTVPGDLRRPDVLAALGTAFAAWKTALGGGWDFFYVSQFTLADVVVTWRPRQEFSDELAHAFYPPGRTPENTPLGQLAGNIMFNSGVPWAVGGGDYDIASVAVHEIGHSLGLEHSADPSSVLYPAYAGVRRRVDPASAEAVRRIYSDPVRKDTLTERLHRWIFGYEISP